MIRSTTALAFALLTPAVFAQTSELYLTSYSTNDAFVVKNGQILRQFSRTAPNDGPALVVQGTVKMYGQYGGSIGREYDYNGGLLAGSYVNAGFVDCYDGATDGTRNWTISHNDFSNNFAVIAGDSNWGNMQVAFVPTRRSSGITFDPTDNTLWITNNAGGCDGIQHYTTSGTLLGEFFFPFISGGGYGIALDPADQTLWVPGAFGTATQLYQFSKAGVLLQTLTVPGLTNTLGAEFGAGPIMITYCTAGTSTNGCLPSISANAPPSATLASSCVINVVNVEGAKSGMLFYGINNTGFTPVQWGFGGNSLLCVKAPTQRMNTQNSGGTAGSCNGTLTQNWNTFQVANPAALGNPFSAGQRVYTQAWYRDPPAVKTTNLSDAIEFVLLP
jgi:hypothetical protein